MLEQHCRQLELEHSDLREHHQRVLRDYYALEQKCSDMEQRQAASQAAANQFRMMEPPSPAPSSVDLTAGSSVADIRALTPSSSPVPPEGIMMNGSSHHHDGNGLALAAVVRQAGVLEGEDLVDELQRKVEDLERQRVVWEGEEGKRKEVEGRSAELQEKLARLKEQHDSEKVALETEKGQLTKEVESLRLSLQEYSSQKLQLEIERLMKENMVSVCLVWCAYM